MSIKKSAGNLKTFFRQKSELKNLREDIRDDELVSTATNDLRSAKKEKARTRKNIPSYKDAQLYSREELSSVKKQYEQASLNVLHKTLHLLNIYDDLFNATKKDTPESVAIHIERLKLLSNYELATRRHSIRFYCIASGLSLIITHGTRAFDERASSYMSTYETMCQRYELTQDSRPASPFSRALSHLPFFKPRTHDVHKDLSVDLIQVNHLQV